MPEHSFSWTDPAATARTGMEMKGIDYMNAIRTGELPAPPISQAFGFELVEIGEGLATFRVEPQDFHCNPMGTVHGGLALTLLDSCCGCCIHTTLEAGEFYGTLETKVNLVRPIMPGQGALLAKGEVVYRGRQVATSEGRLVGEEDGKLYAHGTSTCLIQKVGG